MKTFTLDIEYEYDFELFGLVSSTRDYTLAWHLNRALRLRLVRQPDLPLTLLHRGCLLFSHYLYATEALTVRLFRNRSVAPSQLKKPFLAPDFREYDYLLSISNGVGTLAADALVPGLLALDAVQYVGQVNPNTLKYKENLIL